MRSRALTAAAALLLSGCGITGNFRNDPGFAAFGSPGPLATDREFALSLGPLPLKVARLVLDDDPELGPVLEDLRAVRVYTYEVEADPERVARRVHDAQADLLRDGWVALAAVRDGSELTSVLLRPGERGRNRGLAVIVQDSEEVVFVNLIGNVRLELLNAYMAELDVDVPPIEIDRAALHAQR